ncbi:hypothetical protein BGZ58_000334 [Dissophora ornata]|nr:hypothetical protein BGZ58_000334 [Dissophora ornata]
MNSEQLQYLANTPGHDIKLQEWAELADEATSARNFESLWTSKVLGYLIKSKQEEGRDAYARLSRQTEAERMAVWEAVILGWKHKQNLRPIVFRQEVVVANEQIDGMEDAADQKRKMKATNHAPKKRFNMPNTIPIQPNAQATPPTQSPAAKDSPFNEILCAFNEKATQEQHKTWTLKTGTVVDEVLINYARTCKVEVAAHSFIFDTSNEDIMKKFSEEERMEILAPKTTSFSNDPALVNYLMSFNKTTTAKLRERLQTNDVLTTSTTVLAMADVLDGRAYNGYGRGQSERWFELHVWKMVDDYILNDADVMLIRGESTSPASSFRKNGTSRASAERKKMGRRIDGLYFSCHHDIEMGGIELGPEEQDVIGVKYQYDGLKLQKLLKDQFDYALIHSAATKDDFETMGLQLLGRTMQALSLDWVAGKFLRFGRKEQCRLPLDIKMISELLVVMSQVMLFHEQMRINISKLNLYATTDLLQKLSEPCIIPLQKHTPLPTAKSPSANSKV